MKHSIKLFLQEADGFPFAGENNQATLAAVKAVLPFFMKQELNPMEQQCTNLYYVKELAQRQVAEQLGISQSTVSRNLKKARRKLARYLSYALLAAEKAVSGLDK